MWVVLPYIHKATCGVQVPIPGIGFVTLTAAGQNVSLYNVSAVHVIRIQKQTYTYYRYTHVTTRATVTSQVGQTSHMTVARPQAQRGLSQQGFLERKVGVIGVSHTVD
jgi:hypothetical protein